MKPKAISSMEANRAYLRDLASGKVLVDGERIKVLTPEEARARFGESENDLIVSPVPKLKPSAWNSARASAAKEDGT